MDQRDINSRTRADTFGLRPDLYDALSGNMVTNDSIDEKIEASLNDILPDYGECTIPYANNSYGSSRFLPFTKPIGTQKGCSISSEDGIILNTVGQWQLECQVAVMVSGSSLATAETRLEVFDSDGKFVSRSIGMIRTPSNGGTATNTVAVKHIAIVDRPGYRVRVYAYHIGTAILTNSYWYADEGYTSLSAMYINAG